MDATPYTYEVIADVRVWHYATCSITRGHLAPKRSLTSLPECSRENSSPSVLKGNPANCGTSLRAAQSNIKPTCPHNLSNHSRTPCSGTQPRLCVPHIPSPLGSSRENPTTELNPSPRTDNH